MALFLGYFAPCWFQCTLYAQSRALLLAPGEVLSAPARTPWNLEADPGLQPQVAAQSGLWHSKLKSCCVKLCFAAVPRGTFLQHRQLWAPLPLPAAPWLLDSTPGTAPCVLLPRLTNRRIQNKGLLPSKPPLTLLEAGKKQVQGKERGAHLPLGGRGER